MEPRSSLSFAEAATDQLFRVIEQVELDDFTANQLVDAVPSLARHGARVDVCLARLTRDGRLTERLGRYRVTKRAAA